MTHLFERLNVLQISTVNMSRARSRSRSPTARNTTSRSRSRSRSADPDCSRARRLRSETSSSETSSSETIVRSSAETTTRHQDRAGHSGFSEQHKIREFKLPSRNHKGEYTFSCDEFDECEKLLQTWGYAAHARAVTRKLYGPHAANRNSSVGEQLLHQLESQGRVKSFNAPIRAKSHSSTSCEFEVRWTSSNKYELLKAFAQEEYKKRHNAAIEAVLFDSIKKIKDIDTAFALFDASRAQIRKFHVVSSTPISLCEQQLGFCL